MNNHQFWAPCQNSRGDRPRKCNFRNLRSLWPWPWPWIDSMWYLCAYKVDIYPHTKLYRNWKNFLWTYGHIGVQ